MEVALRRRLAGVADVSISQSRQTVNVSFVPGTFVFSAAAFREAVAEAEVEVLALEAQVCGVVAEDGVLRPLSAREPPLVRLHGRPSQTGDAICVAGRLDDAAVPYVLEIAELP